MELKGESDKAISEALISEKLAHLSDISTKKMFGGYGILHAGKMFGLINPKGIIFLKVDEASKAKYAKLGSIPHSKMPYSSVPEDILTNLEALENWAHHAISLIKR